MTKNPSYREFWGSGVTLPLAPPRTIASFGGTWGAEFGVGWPTFLKLSASATLSRGLESRLPGGLGDKLSAPGTSVALCSKSARGLGLTVHTFLKSMARNGVTFYRVKSWRITSFLKSDLF